MLHYVRMYVSRYHSFLRVLLLVSAIVLIFDSGIFIPATKQISRTTTAYMASVGSGMFASVPENEVNALSAKISEQQRVLDAREASLREREIAARSYTSDDTGYSTYIISVMLFIIIVLLVVNYIMDFVRFKQYLRILNEQKSLG